LNADEPRSGNVKNEYSSKPNSIQFYNLIDDDVGLNIDTDSNKNIKLSLLQYRLNNDYYDYENDQYIKLFDDVFIDLSDKSKYNREIIRKHLLNKNYFVGDINVDPITGSISLNKSVHFHLPNFVPPWLTRKHILWILSMGLSLKFGIVSARFVRKQINDLIMNYSSKRELNVTFKKINNKYVLFEIHINPIDFISKFGMLKVFMPKKKHNS
jgi:hypothetical protein